jgi:1-acyl-sn-glycerol-3-phosphate acyltransferase
MNWEPLTSFYAFSRFCSAVLLNTVTTLRVEGYEHIPSEGPVIVAPNHITYFDPPLVGAVFPRQVFFMAKKELFEGVVGLAVKGCRAFPVNRGTADRKAIHTALDYLKQGRVVCIFPQGTRDRSGGISAVEMGLALIAEKSQSPILPMGLYYTDPKTFSPGFGSAVSVRIGAPFRFERSGENRKESMEIFNDKVVKVLSSLIETARNDVVLKK